jgi:hypothetical protein
MVTSSNKRAGPRLVIAGAALMLGLLLAAPASATVVGEDSIFGIGGIAGEPTGATLKLWFGDSGFAFQAHAAIMWWDIHRLALLADFLWHPMRITDNEYFDLLWYFGVGGGAGFRAPWDDKNRPPHKAHDDWDADPAVWIRLPFGFPFRFHKVRVEAFIEFGPTLRFEFFDDDTDFDIRGFFAVGGRYYF